MREQRCRGWLAGGVLATVLVLVSSVAPAAPAAAQGQAGPCGPSDADGVTVVVDYQELGGDVAVRCAPDADGSSAVDALRQAGFGVEGAGSWGDAFVCRITGRPAGDETLEVPGHAGYRETCLTTPPGHAYWSSWWSRDAGTWTLAQEGGATRRVIAGDVEGWSFSLGDARTRPPRFDPVRGERTTEGDDLGDGGVSTGSPTHEAEPGRGTASGQEQAAAQEQDGGSPWPLALTALVVAGLAGAGGLVLRRRAS